MSEARGRLIASRMQDFVEDERLKLGISLAEISRGYASRGTIRSARHFLDFAEAHWATTKRVIEHRVALEAEVPGGPSPTLEQEIDQLFEEEANLAEERIRQFASHINNPDATAAYFETQRTTLGNWARRQVQQVIDKAELGILHPGLHIVMDSQALANALALIAERSDEVSAQGLREIAEAIRANDRETALDKVSKAVETADKAKGLTEAVVKLMWQLISAWQNM